MSAELQRREFLQIAAAAGGAMASGGLLGRAWAADEPKEPAVQERSELPIIDTHQHLWDLTKFNLPWTKGNEVLGRSFVTRDYLEATKGLNVVQAVYMEVDLHPSQQVEEAEYVIDLCKRDDNPTVAGVISGRPASDEFKTYIGRYKDNPYIKGVRQVLHGEETPPGYCLGDQFVRSVQLLGELGKVFDLCMRPGELRDADALVGRCPRTRFVVDHCGNIDVKETDESQKRAWRDGMKALAQRENTICKVSGIVAAARENWKPADLEPAVRFTIETFGPERVMFAGDWPVCTLRATFRQWVEALQEIVAGMGMSQENRKKLFHDNAVRFYGLAATKK